MTPKEDGYYVAEAIKLLGRPKKEVVQVEVLKDRVWRCGVQIGYHISDYKFFNMVKL